MSNIIEITDLKKYYGKRLIFKNLDFTIHENDFVLISGRSGCGKSTLLNILSFQDFKYEGSYLFEEKNVKKYHHLGITQIRNSAIGFVYQDYGLIRNKTVKENILLPYVYNDKTINYEWYNKLLEILGISNLQDKNINLLSGGEKQRVSIARSIILKPKIIFLDEPFSNLDENNKIILINQLNLLTKNENIAVAIVSHDVPSYLLEVITNRLNMEKYYNEDD